ncbi:MAG: hypothetical protein AAGF56_04035, partial [Pseudomonadota bacterium]
MTDKKLQIETSAELLENDVLPMAREVHTDPDAPCVSEGDLPRALAEPANRKSPAQWAYERIVLYIQEFEKQLDAEHEVAM